MSSALKIRWGKAVPLTKGTVRPKAPHGRQIIIWFEQELFDEIASLATKSRCHFAEQVRTLVTWGLLQDHDGESSAPKPASASY